jgi:hypothetical protein
VGRAGAAAGAAVCSDADTVAGADGATTTASTATASTTTDVPTADQPGILSYCHVGSPNGGS